MTGSCRAETPDAGDAVSRLMELMGIGDGWGEYGDEAAPDRNRLHDLVEAYRLFGRSLVPPHIYPMPDGNIEFEWESDGLLVMDVALASLIGTLYTDDGEFELDLKTAEGWDALESKVGADAVRRRHSYSGISTAQPGLN